MPATRSKQHFLNVAQYDGLDSFQFQPVTLANNMVSTAIQGIWVLPTSAKIYKAIAYMSGSPAGTCSINLVSGIAAELATQFASLPIPDTEYGGQPVAPGAAAYPPAYATAGQKLFLSDQPVTMTTNVATVLTASDSAASGAYAPGTPGNAWDGLWGPAGSIITLRCVTNASGAGTLTVAVLYKLYDPTYNKPILTPFNPATDLP